MKRSEALTALSRDHHKALAVALRLRRATPETIAAALASFSDYFEVHGDRHFQAEEAELLPVLAGLPGGAEFGDRICAEHEQLRRLADQALAPATTPDAALSPARQLGEQLTTHVRFEEREVFPFVEAELSDAELAALGERLDAAA